VILVDKEEQVLRLQKKLEHWIAHNKEHAESFRKAAREAEEIGLVEVSKRLNEAATRMEEIASVLEVAMDDFG
jgi:ferric-dicitrate binding protein FerR (iron transport regulator)